jgi:hypothetical membrane protein
MADIPRPYPITRFLLRLGITIPFIYYGIQLLAAPFFPHFSIVRTTASELGSNLTPYQGVFNIGIIFLSVITLFAAIGFLLALYRLGVNLLVTLLTSLALATNAFQCFWAGIHPMPDPRHGGHPPLIVAMVILPFLLTASTWRATHSRAVKVYFIATCLLLLAFVPIMSGISGLNTHDYRGLIQRIFTLTIFPPIAVAAHILSRVLSNKGNKRDSPA